MLALLYEIMNSCFGSSKRTGALQEFAGRLAVMFSANCSGTRVPPDFVFWPPDADERQKIQFHIVLGG